MNAKGTVGQTSIDLAIEFVEEEIGSLLRKHGGKAGEELRTEGK